MIAETKPAAAAAAGPLQLDTRPASLGPCGRDDLGSPTSPMGYEPQPRHDAGLAWLSPPQSEAAPAWVDELVSLPPPLLATVADMAAAQSPVVKWIVPDEAFAICASAPQFEAALARFFPEPLPRQYASSEGSGHALRFLVRLRANGFYRLAAPWSHCYGRRGFSPRASPPIRASPPPAEPRPAKRVRFSPAEPQVVGVADPDADRSPAPCARLSVGEYLEVRALSRVPVENLSAAQGVMPRQRMWQIGRNDHLRLAPGGWADCFLGMGC